MKLFFENLTENVKVPMDFPLDAVLEQAKEIFENLPEDDGSTFGIVSDDLKSILFSKFNKFMWMVEIPEHSQHGVYKSICNKHQCSRLIENVFEGIDPFKVCEFKFESYL